MLPYVDHECIANEIPFPLESNNNWKVVGPDENMICIVSESLNFVASYQPKRKKKMNKKIYAIKKFDRMNKARKQPANRRYKKNYT